jgi:hypothetical protein
MLSGDLLRVAYADLDPTREEIHATKADKCEKDAMQF